MLKDRIPTKDEAALFEIANKYDLRHRKTDQHGDYDAAFLEWIFHWYLATVALLSRLIERESPSRAATACPTHAVTLLIEIASCHLHEDSRCYI